MEFGGFKVMEDIKYEHGYTLFELIEAGKEKNKQFEFNESKVDILAKVTFLKDVRKTSAITGYRPHHQVNDDYLTTGMHVYYENNVVFPGDCVNAYITFITPEHYPKCLFKGKIVDFGEGEKVVGYIEVVEIYNSVLQNT